LKKENKWIKLYVKEKVKINNDKESICNFSKINKIIYKRRHLLKISKTRNKFSLLLRRKKIYYSRTYNDFICLNRVRGLAKWRFIDLVLKNCNNFGLIHEINKKYIDEDKKDDYYK